MGHLIYGSATEYQIDDRALAHLKVVVGAKLRRQESFFMSWIIDPDAGSGRVSLWVGPTIPLQFHFSGGRAPSLNQAWLDVLAESSHTVGGLVLMPETEAEAIHRGERPAERES